MTEEELRLIVSMKLDAVNKQLSNLKRTVSKSFQSISKDKNVDKATQAISKGFEKSTKDSTDDLKKLNTDIRKEMIKAEREVDKATTQIKRDLEDAFDHAYNIKVNSKSATDATNKIKNSVGSGGSSGMSNVASTAAVASNIANIASMNGVANNLKTVMSEVNNDIYRMTTSTSDLVANANNLVEPVEALNNVMVDVKKILAAAVMQFQTLVEMLDKVSKIQIAQSMKDYNDYITSATTKIKELSEIWKKIHASTKTTKFDPGLGEWDESVYDDGEIFSPENLNDYIQRLTEIRNLVDNIRSLGKLGIFSEADQGALNNLINQSDEFYESIVNILSSLDDGQLRETLNNLFNDPSVFDMEELDLGKYLSEKIKTPLISSEEIVPSQEVLDLRQQLAKLFEDIELDYKIRTNTEEAVQTAKSVGDRIRESIEEKIKGIKLVRSTQGTNATGDDQQRFNFYEGYMPEVDKLKQIMADLKSNNIDVDTTDLEKLIELLEKLGFKREELNKDYNIDLGLDDVKARLTEIFNIGTYDLGDMEILRNLGYPTDQLDTIVDMLQRASQLSGELDGYDWGQGRFVTAADAGGTSNHQRIKELRELAKHIEELTGKKIDLTIDEHNLVDSFARIDSEIKKLESEALSAKGALGRMAEVDNMSGLEILKTQFKELSQLSKEFGIYKMPDLSVALDGFKTGIEGLKGKVAEVKQDMINRFSEAASKVKLTLKDALYAVGGFFTIPPQRMDEIGAQLREKFSGWFDNIRNMGSDAIHGITDKIAGKIFNGSDMLDLQQFDYSQAETVKQKLQIIFSSIRITHPKLDGFIEGCNNAFNRVKQAASTTAEHVKVAFEKFSNSRLGAFANNVGSVFVKGFNKAKQVITDFTKKYGKEAKKINKTTGDIANKTKKGTGNFAAGLKGLLGKLGIFLSIGMALKALWGFTTEAIQLEGSISNLYKTLGRYDDEFGNTIFNGDKYLDWANNTAQAFGISKKAAIQYGNTFSMLLSDFAKFDTTQVTTDLLEQAAVIAAGTGRTMDDVLERIRSGMLGNTESIEDLGVFVSANTLEGLLGDYSDGGFVQTYGKAIKDKLGKSVEDLAKNYDNLTDVEKQAIRYYGIMYQSAKRFGKASTDSLNTTAGLYLKFQAQIENTKLALGEAFKPLVTLVLPALTAVLKKIEEIALGLGEILTQIASIFGYEVTDFKTGVQDVDVMYNSEVQEGAKEDEAAMDKLKTNLAGIDEITKITSKTEGNDPKKSGLDDKDVKDYNKETKETPKWLQKIKDALAIIKKYAIEIGNAFKEGWDLATHIDSVEELKERWEKTWQIIKDVGKAIKDIFTMDLSDAEGVQNVLGSIIGMVKEFAKTVGVLLGSAFEVLWGAFDSVMNMIKKWLEQNGEYIANKLNDIFTIRTETLTKLQEAILFIKNLLLHIFENEHFQQIGADLLAIFSDAFLNVQVLVEKLMRDIIGAIIQPFTDNLDAFKTAIDNFLAPLSQMITAIKDTLRGLYEDIQAMYDEHIKPLFEAIGQGLSDIFANILDAYNTYLAPVLQALADKFDALMEKLRPALTEIVELIGNIVDIIKILWNILVPIVNFIIDFLVPIVGPLIEGLGKVIMDVIGAIVDAIKGVLEILNGLLDFLLGVFTLDWERAWEGIKSIFTGVWDVIWGILSGIGQGLWDAFSGICEALLGVFQGLLDAILGLFGIHSPSTVMYDIGANLIKGLWNGIKDLKSWILDKISGFFSSITGSIKDFFGINSPSKLFAWIGEMLMIGFGVGIEDESKENPILDTFKDIASKSTDVVGEMASTINSKLVGLMKGVSGTTTGIGDALGSLKGVDLVSTFSVEDLTSNMVKSNGHGSSISTLFNHDAANGWMDVLANKITNVINATSGVNTRNSDKPLEVVMQVGTNEFGRVSVNSINSLQKKEGKILIDNVKKK